MAALIPVLTALKPDERRVIYISKKGVEVTATKTQRFSDDDFAVGLVIPGRKEFYPTHIRLLFDLYLKHLNNPAEAKQLFYAIEKVYDGADPDEFASEVDKLKFLMYLDEPMVNLYYAQLLMIEQDFNFIYEKLYRESDKLKRRKPSKVNPPREFLMRFIRWVASGDEEIDKIIFLAVTRKPAPQRYGTSL